MSLSASVCYEILSGRRHPRVRWQVAGKGKPDDVHPRIRAEIVTKL